MNIFCLSELYYPNYGGAELATHLYMKKLAEKGHKVKVLTHRFPGEEQISREKNISIHRVPLINKKSPKYTIQSRFDILLSTFFHKLVDWSDFVYIPRLWYTSIPFIKKMGKPVVVHLHDYLPICPLSTRFDLSKKQQCENRVCHPSCVVAAEEYENKSPKEVFISTALNTTLGQSIGRFAHDADLLIFVSEKQMETTLQKAPHLRPKAHVVYNQMPYYQNNPIMSEDFGYFGGLSVIKGLPILYEALDILKTRGMKIPKIHATKMLSDPKYYDIHKHKTEGMIPYGRLSNEDFRTMYSSVQTVIVPSLWQEPLAYVVAEALLGEKLLICANIGGLPELMKNCKGAFRFEPGNPSELAEAIDYVNNLDQEEKRSLGKHNRETFMKGFNNDKNIERFIKLVKDIL